MGQFVLPTLRRDNLSPMLNPKFGYFGDFNADKIEEYKVRRNGRRGKIQQKLAPRNFDSGRSRDYVESVF